MCLLSPILDGFLKPGKVQQLSGPASFHFDLAQFLLNDGKFFSLLVSYRLACGQLESDLDGLPNKQDQLTTLSFVCSSNLLS